MKRAILFLFCVTACFGQGLTLRSPLRDIAPAAASGFDYNSLTNGMVAYYKLEESGGSRSDSFDGNTMVDVFGMTSTTGKIGQSPELSLSSNIGFLYCPDNPSFSCTNIDFTITFWMKLSNTNASYGLVGKWGETREYCTYWTLGMLNAYVSDAVTYTNVISSATIAQDTWYFVCHQWDNAAQSVSVSINNGTFDSKTFNHGIADGTNSFNIGSLSSPNSGTIGTIDEVAVWRRKVATNELALIYNAGAARTCCPFAP